MEGPGKSWNLLLGYDAGGRHNGVGVGAAGAKKLLNFFLPSAVYNVVNSCNKFSDNLFAISQLQ